MRSTVKVIKYRITLKGEIKMTNRTFTDLMDTLELPGVKQHMNSLPVQLGLEVLKKRIELDLTQAQVVKLGLIRKISLTQAQLSRIENGDTEISIDKYLDALHVLGGHLKPDVEFDNPPTKQELQTI